jgi:hypothetical protein
LGLDGCCRCLLFGVWLLGRIGDLVLLINGGEGDLEPGRLRDVSDSAVVCLPRRLLRPVTVLIGETTFSGWPRQSKITCRVAGSRGREEDAKTRDAGNVGSPVPLSSIKGSSSHVFFHVITYI